MKKLWTLLLKWPSLGNAFHMPFKLISYVPRYRVVLCSRIRTTKPTEERVIYNKLTWILRAYLARSTLRRNVEKEFLRVSAMFSVVALFENSTSFSRALSCRFFNFCLPGTLNSSSFLRKTNVRFKFLALGRLELSSFAMMVLRIKSELEDLETADGKTEVAQQLEWNVS